MKHTDRWIQIATTLSILLGLGLVIWELQQVKTLSRAQLTSDFISTANSVQLSILGEDPSTALAKACTEPQNLTLRETLIVNEYYMSHLNLVARMILLTDRDGLYPEGYWQDQIGFLNPIFNSAYGRVWFAGLNPLGWPDGLFAEVDDRISQLGPPNCKSIYDERIESFRSNLPEDRR